MAYADYEFYKTSFFGNVVPESDFNRFSERASDFIDVLTFDRLVDGLPGDERQQKRIKKAVCAAVDILYQIDIAEQNAAAAATGLKNIKLGGIGILIVLKCRQRLELEMQKICMSTGENCYTAQ